jgi:ABC-type nitrate/sulfonate/bicarbonate transport system substrate-binding protein
VHPSISQAADLRGKKIGVALLGDSEDRFTTMFVERAGLTAKDVTKITLGTSPSDKILGIKSGAVAAVVLDPAGAVAAEKEGLKKLAFLGDIFPLPFQGYVVTDRKIAENPAQVKRWIRSVLRGLMFVRERPEEAAEVAAKKLRLEAIRNYVLALPAGIPGLPSAQGIRNILEYEIRLPMKMDAPVAAEKFLDFRHVAEVRKELEAQSAGR